MLSIAKTGSQTPVLNGELEVTLAAGDGNDVVTAALPADLSAGTLYLRADGGAGNDRMVIGVDTSSSTAAARHDVLVSGGPGNDLLTLDQTAAAGGILAGVSIVGEGFGSVDRCTAGGGHAAAQTRLRAVAAYV